MKVFLSWSGERSHAAAQALNDWIPDVLQDAVTWMSADIEAGQRWSREIDEELSETDFGVLCLTRENLQAPWIMFEAGALAKRVVEDARVVPYLADDLELSDLKPPLSLFQAKKADRVGTLGLINSINTHSEARQIDEARLHRVFNGAWPRLEEMLQVLPDAGTGPTPRRDTADILDEILETVRGISRRQGQEPVAHSVTLDPQAVRSWGDIVKALRSTSPAIAAVYAEAECLRFADDEVILRFPEDLAVYTRLAKYSGRLEPLKEIIEERYGIQPAIRFRSPSEGKPSM